jgi:hypothetical protein
VDRQTQDSAPRNEESVWTAYNITKAKETERLSAAELATEPAVRPESADQKGNSEAKTLTAPTMTLSKRAILRALSVKSASLRAAFSGSPLPKEPHHIPLRVCAIDL